MIKLNNREIDDYGNSIYTEEGIVNRILSGQSVENCYVDNDKCISDNNYFKENIDEKIENLLKYEVPDESLEKFDKIHQNYLLIPDSYKNINLYSYLIKKCSSEEERDRIEYEYTLISDRNMVNFFKCMIYLVDVFRKNNVLWGIGRGSSVSCFSLYIIGIHRVNSIKFDLDCHEFFK